MNALRRLAPRAAAAVLAVAAAWPAFACPVCYGEAEDPVLDATRWSVAVMGGLVYVLLGGGVGLVLAQRRKVRRAAGAPPADARRGLRLVPPPDDPTSGDTESDTRS